VLGGGGAAAAAAECWQKHRRCRFLLSKQVLPWKLLPGATPSLQGTARRSAARHADTDTDYRYRLQNSVGIKGPCDWGAPCNMCTSIPLPFLKPSCCAHCKQRRLLLVHRLAWLHIKPVVCVVHGCHTEGPSLLPVVPLRVVQP
jgi:hypothetical protein